MGIGDFSICVITNYVNILIALIDVCTEHHCNEHLNNCDIVNMINELSINTIELSVIFLQCYTINYDINTYIIIILLMSLWVSEMVSLFSYFDLLLKEDFRIFETRNNSNIFTTPLE